MIRLYRRDAEKFEYWQVWENDKASATVQHGVVGEKGNSKVIHSSFFQSHRKKVEKEVAQQMADGFVEIPESEHEILVIEYIVSGFGSAEDLDKRHALEDLLQEILVSNGLGICDGGSIGSGTMDAVCLVVDFEIAKKAIVEAISEGEFSDFSRIYQVDLEED